MKRIDFLKRKMQGYLKKEQLLKDEEYIKLEKPYLRKARKNFTIANMLLKISDEDSLKKVLKLASDFETFDWVIIVAYYAMYTSALAALSKLGFKSKSHAITLVILEYYYVQQQRDLEIKYLHKLSNAYRLSEDLINKLIQTKIRRETAQYDATPSISGENAKTALEDADEFITRIEEILS